ncbi:hypothetical protein [Rhizobium sp. Root483D2]|uniref:hypothetical protein n=1 Tax=Rhizobium sp. Root483D2 TaxID=1736545 RepID=UPI000AF15FD4|nr:hypothetical protein [Rhizobium sp. Root483D2]
MMKTVVACAAACVLFVAAGPVSADEGNNLIWAPSKTGENAYRLRLGAQYSGSVNVSGGSDFSVSATKAGRVQAPPSVGIWGLLSRKKKAGPAATASQDVDVRFEAAHGSGNVRMSSSRQWIASRHIDIEGRRSLALQCNAYETQCAKARLSQSARVTAVATGTALVAQSSLDRARFAKSRLPAFDQLGVEQSFGSLNLSAAVTNPWSSARGVFKAHYALSW